MIELFSRIAGRSRGTAKRWLVISSTTSLQTRELTEKGILRIIVALHSVPVQFQFSSTVMAFASLGNGDIATTDEVKGLG